MTNSKNASGESYLHESTSMKRCSGMIQKNLSFECTVALIHVGFCNGQGRVVKSADKGEGVECHNDDVGDVDWQAGPFREALCPKVCESCGRWHVLLAGEGSKRRGAGAGKIE